MIKSLMPLKRMMKKLRALVAVLAASVMLAGTLTGAAALPSPPTQPEKTEACWQDDLGGTACAPTEAELRRVILSKYNKILVDSKAELASVMEAKTYESMAVPDSAQATYSLGKLYTDINYTGSVWIPSTTNASVCYGSAYYYPYPSVVHNDQYSSFFGNNGCQLRLFDDINYGGGYYGYYDCRSNLANVGYNDRASSVIFYLATSYSCF